MKIDRTALAKVIVKRLAKNESPKKLSRSVAAYLLESGQTGQLASLIRDVQADRAKAGQVEILAEAAHPLSSEVKADISRLGRRLYGQAKTLQVTELNNPDLIGGVRLRTADQELDLSVAHKLFRLRSVEGRD